MAIPRFDADLNIISKLADKPNDAGGLSAQAFKEEFDRAGLLVKEYINEILVPRATIDIDNAAKGIGGSEGIDGSAIVAGTVTASKLATNSVTAEKIAEDAVTAGKIAPKAVTEEAFADASVPTRAYRQGSVTAAALAQDSVTADKLADGAVSNAKLADGSVTAAKVAAAARTQYFDFAVGTEGWTGEAAPYSQTIAVAELLETDRAVIRFSAPDSFEELDAQQEAFALLYTAESADGAITLYAKELPETAFNVVLEVARI